MDFTGIFKDGDDKRYTLSKAAPEGVKDEFYKSGDGKELDDTFEIVQQMIDFGEYD